MNQHLFSKASDSDSDSGGEVDRIVFTGGSHALCDSVEEGEVVMSNSLVIDSLEERSLYWSNSASKGLFGEGGGGGRERCLHYTFYTEFSVHVFLAENAACAIWYRTNSHR